MFKIYKAEVENQQNRKIKVINPNLSGEYYDRYDGSDAHDLLSIFWKSGIVAQYTISWILGHLIKMMLLRDEIAH